MGMEMSLLRACNILRKCLCAESGKLEVSTLLHTDACEVWHNDVMACAHLGLEATSQIPVKSEPGMWKRAIGFPNGIGLTVV